jgi:dihydroorotate dehydrogenase (fumarate)
MPLAIATLLRLATKGCYITTYYSSTLILLLLYGKQYRQPNNLTTEQPNNLTMAPSLKTSVASIPFETCVYNASGPRTGSGQALSKIALSRSGAVLAKSATLSSQTGNPLPRTWHHGGQDSHASMNSEGLPNSGIDYYISTETIDETMSNGQVSKPYFVSISGKNVDDNMAMLNQIHAKIISGEKRIAGVELNLACPNIIGKPIIAYDFDQMESVLEALTKLPIFTDSKVPLGVKVSTCII